MRQHVDNQPLKMTAGRLTRRDAPRSRNLLEKAGKTVWAAEGDQLPAGFTRVSGLDYQAVQRATSGQPPPRSQIDYCSAGPPPFFGVAILARRHCEWWKLGGVAVVGWPWWGGRGGVAVVGWPWWGGRGGVAAFWVPLG